MFFDPLYMLIVMLPGLLISGFAGARVHLAFEKQSRQISQKGLSGAAAARQMLDAAGLHHVKIKPTSGHLSDHYDPSTKTLGLSSKVYAKKTVAAIGVACHEAGHALQHANGYAALHVRSALVPVAGLGSNLGLILMAIGLALKPLLFVGALLFSLTVIFQLITLPVEFDASARAKKLALSQGLVTEREVKGVSQVLTAAALTYVAAAITSVMTLLYYLWRAGVIGGKRS